MKSPHRRRSRTINKASDDKADGPLKPANRLRLRFFEIARVLVRFDHDCLLNRKRA